MWTTPPSPSQRRQHLTGTCWEPQHSVPPVSAHGKPDDGNFPCRSLNAETAPPREADAREIFREKSPGLKLGAAGSGPHSHSHSHGSSSGLGGGRLGFEHGQRQRKGQRRCGLSTQWNITLPSKKLSLAIGSHVDGSGGLGLGEMSQSGKDHYCMWV